MEMAGAHVRLDAGTPRERHGLAFFRPIRLSTSKTCASIDVWISPTNVRCAKEASLPVSEMSELVEVIDKRGRMLTPCRRSVAEREVSLQRAKWVGPRKIRLRFDPYAHRYIRLKILQRDGHICYWCGRPGTTIDHVIPWSKGGRTTMDNCICACTECNGLRGNVPAETFAERMQVPPPKAGKVLPSDIRRSQLHLVTNDLVSPNLSRLQELLDPHLSPYQHPKNW